MTSVTEGNVPFCACCRIFGTWFVVFVLCGCCITGYYALSALYSWFDFGAGDRSILFGRFGRGGFVLTRCVVHRYGVKRLVNFGGEKRGCNGAICRARALVVALYCGREPQFAREQTCRGEYTGGFSTLPNGSPFCCASVHYRTYLLPPLPPSCLVPLLQRSTIPPAIIIRFYFPFVFIFSCSFGMDWNMTLPRVFVPGTIPTFLSLDVWPSTNEPTYYRLR